MCASVPSSLMLVEGGGRRLAVHHSGEALNPGGGFFFV